METFGICLGGAGLRHCRPVALSRRRIGLRLRHCLASGQTYCQNGCERHGSEHRHVSLQLEVIDWSVLASADFPCRRLCGLRLLQQRAIPELVPMKVVRNSAGRCAEDLREIGSGVPCRQADWAAVA